MDWNHQSPRARLGNVLPIEGWIEPLGCSQCHAEEVTRVDLVECAKSVRGLRQPGDRVIVDEEGAQLDRDRVVARFFRCSACDYEWPVHPATRFIEPERSPA